jgi:hypothetical protein
MARLTLELLRKRLAGSDWNKTEHVLASISEIAVLVHRLEYSPLWGFRWLDTCRVDKPWQDELTKAASGFTMPDPISEFLKSGELAQGSLMLRAAAFQGLLTAAFAGRNQLSKDATLLPLGEPVDPVWYEVLVGALGLRASNVLRPEPASNPWDIRALLATQSRTFPGLLSMPIAERRGDEIVVGRLPLLTPRSPAGPDGRFRVARSLWLPPGATSTRVCLTYRGRGMADERVLDEVELTPKVNPFTLSIVFRPGEMDPTLRVNGGDWTRPEHFAVLPRRDDLLASVSEPGKTASLAFLLDGSMSEQEFEDARKFIIGVAEDLAGSTPPVRLACVVYAEYLERVDQKRTVPWKYDVQLHQFSDPNSFKTFITGIERAGVVDDDPCDALELGLKKAQQLAWDGEARVFVVVGNSPPHPSHEERTRLKLLDRETEQHMGIRWEDELWEICRSAQPGLRLGSAWVGPRLGGKELDAYAQAVWQKLAADFLLPSVGDNEQRSLADYLRRLRDAIFVLDQPVSLPLARPLTVWMRRGKLAV